MTKTIITKFGGCPIEVETVGKLWNFRAGDLITSVSRTSAWREKQVIVEGFRGENLWGRIKEEKACMVAITPHGLTPFKKRH